VHRASLWDFRTFILNRHKFIISVYRICHLNMKLIFKLN
jgi:hypothetical protein